MDKELNDLFAQLMSNPDTVEKLGGMLTSLTAAPPPAAEKAGQGDMLGRLLPLLQGVTSGDDREITLLRALRPYLHNGREKRVDEAIEMLRLAKLLPLLTEKRGEVSHGE
ncbi:MAG: hypothetical protein E7552_05550 [Ruminococcaceae bacterium]|nr:hypothetical protein [Oscillospiraceae bacterium]